MRKSGIAFHCHHDTLFEYVYDFDERVDYIKENKPKNGVELRLRLFKLIPKDRLPKNGWAALDKAGNACNKAWAAFLKAREAYYKKGKAYEKARDAYFKARDAYFKANKKEFEKLHNELCPNCPWDGETIFSKGVE